MKWRIAAMEKGSGIESTMKTYVIIIVSALSIAVTNAQEIGIAPVKLWTGNYEFQDPLGVGITISIPVRKLRLSAEYVFAQHERTYSGYLSGGFIVSPLPATENVRSTSSLSAYEFSLSVPALLQNSDFGFHLGLGYSFDTYSDERTGLTSGNKVSFGKVVKSGPFFICSAEYFLLTTLRFELGYKLKILSTGEAATDMELPFESIVTVQELQFNVVYKLF
jgi:hypothetical protein